MGKLAGTPVDRTQGVDRQAFLFSVRLYCQQIGFGGIAQLGRQLGFRSDAHGQDVLAHQCIQQRALAGAEGPDHWYHQLGFHHFFKQCLIV